MSELDKLSAFKSDSIQVYLRSNSGQRSIRMLAYSESKNPSEVRLLAAWLLEAADWMEEEEAK